MCEKEKTDQKYIEKFVEWIRNNELYIPDWRESADRTLIIMKRKSLCM